MVTHTWILSLTYLSRAVYFHKQWQIKCTLLWCPCTNWHGGCCIFQFAVQTGNWAESMGPAFMGKRKSSWGWRRQNPPAPIRAPQALPCLTSRHFSKCPLPASSSAPASVPRWLSRAQFQLLRRKRLLFPNCLQVTTKHRYSFTKYLRWEQQTESVFSCDRNDEWFHVSLQPPFPQPIINSAVVSECETVDLRAQEQAEGHRRCVASVFTRGNKQIWKSCLISSSVS